MAAALGSDVQVPDALLRQARTQITTRWPFTQNTLLRPLDADSTRRSVPPSTTADAIRRQDDDNTKSYLVYQDAACALEASFYLASHVKACRLPCDIQDTANDDHLSQYRRALYTADSTSANPHSIRNAFNGLIGQIRETTAVFPRHAFPDTMESWDIMVRGVSQFCFTTSRVRFCLHPSCQTLQSVGEPTLRTHVPLPDRSDESQSHRYYFYPNTASEVCNAFFEASQSHTEECPQCGFLLVEVQVVLDRLPYHLMMAWPAYDRDWESLKAGISQLDFRYVHIENGLSVATMNSARSLLLNEHQHTTSFIRGSQGWEDVGWSKDALKMARRGPLRIKASEIVQNKYVQGVLLQRRM